MEGKRKTIIIVDDDITNLNIARNILIQKYDVFTVPSGKKLIQILEKISPDLILLDLEMPEMNGYEVLELLKSKDSSAGIPVIFLSATLNPEGNGDIDSITKPFSGEFLLERMEAYLGEA